VKVLRAIDLAVPAIGALASAGLAAAGLTGVAIGAVCGTVIASLSWGGLHLIGRHLIGSGGQTRLLLAALMGLKFLAISALVLVSVTLLGMSGIGVAVGMSAMPLAILTMFALFGSGSGEAARDGQSTEVKGDA
jgi:hypothetical protein